MRGVGRDAGAERERQLESREELDREMLRLPRGEREAVILRYLEGRSETEAAAIAGCPVGTISRRASQGLARLRARLVGRGTAVTAGALAGLLAAEGAVALPQTLLASLADIPALATGAAAGGTGNSLVLAKGVMKAMFWTKVKIAVALVCATAGLGVGTPAALRALAAAPVAGGGRVAGPGERTSVTDIEKTALWKFAAAMRPGEIKKFPTKNYTRDLMKSWYDWEKNLRGAHKGYSIISWSADAHWDPVSRQIFYFGLGHYASPKFVKYSADTNEWKLLELPKWADKRRNGKKK
jgi:hypothetical protein